MQQIRTTKNQKLPPSNMAEFYTYIHYHEDWRNPFYVGKGLVKNNRAYNTKDRNIFWKNYVAKYGERKVKIIHHYNNESDAMIAEKALIGFFGRKDKRDGILVNLTDGGEGMAGHIKSKELRERMGLLRKGDKHPMYGKKHTDESRKKMSDKLIGLLVGEKNGMFGRSGDLNPMYGKKHAPETVEKQRLDKIGKYDGEKNPFYGKTHNEKTRKFLRERMLGTTMAEGQKAKIKKTMHEKYQSGKYNFHVFTQENSSRSKPILDPRTGVFYFSIADAALYYKIERHDLSDMLQGKRPNKTHLIFA